MQDAILILNLDKNDFVVKLQTRLIEAGYNVIFTNKVEIRDITNYSVKLIIVDLEEEEIFGNLMKIRETNKALKIIIITSSNSIDKRIKAEELGCNAYFEEKQGYDYITKAIKKLLSSKV